MDEDGAGGEPERGHKCSSSRCGKSRARSRQLTLWGMWGSSSNDSRGESSRGSEVEVNGLEVSWGGPSKDRKGDG